MRLLCSVVELVVVMVVMWRVQPVVWRWVLEELMEWEAWWQWLAWQCGLMAGVRLGHGRHCHGRRHGRCWDWRVADGQWCRPRRRPWP